MVTVPSASAKPPAVVASRSVTAFRRRPAVLVIAASDSSGGAGLARDIRVLNDFEVEPLCAVTAVTAQSDAEVLAVHPVPPEIILAQVSGALRTRPVAAIKIGMLADRATVEAVATALPPQAGAGGAIPVVLDPVLVSSSGGVLLDAGGRAALLERLSGRATVLTPNVPETAALLGEAVARCEADLVAQGRRLLRSGCGAVLLKGGHGRGEDAVDLLLTSEGEVERLASRRLEGGARGTGCALASAIAAGLAVGLSLAAACRQARGYVLRMITAAHRDTGY